MIAMLNEYNQKRDFDKTNEPRGAELSFDESLKFVVQHHIASREHYDFRLEWRGVLLSWAIPKGPSYNTKDKRLAVKVEDHPIEYRNFEGTIPKGEYGGGVVMLWDEGIWEPQGNVDEGLEDGVLKFILKGIRLNGKWALIRLKTKKEEANDNWLLLKEKDEFVKDNEGISEFKTSIRTNRTMLEIENKKEDKNTKNPFNEVNVQLAKLVSEEVEGDDWIYELKYDGYRIVSFVEGSNVRLVTRNNNDYTSKFHDIVLAILDMSKHRSMVLDGEVVIIDETGKTDFQELQNYLKNKNNKNLVYIVFDLLAIDGIDIRGYPLIKRKEILEALMKDAPKSLYYSRFVKGRRKESFEAACNANMEGIVGKKINSIYSGTRNKDWIKLKCEKRQEFIIGGYSLSNKKTSGISSLLLGVYEKENLVYVGRAGTGFSNKEMKMLEEKFKIIKRIHSPFKDEPAKKPNEKITWLEPNLVAEIKFAEITKDNLLRQASYKGLRSDKNPKDVKIEKAEDKDIIEENNKSNLIVQKIKITNPKKIIFEEQNITKEEVVKYYEKISERMLLFLNYRILTTVRCPKGVATACFYKKHPDPSSKEIKTISINTTSQEEYFYIEDIFGLIHEVQMGSIEFHIWGSNVKTIDKPDIMVFDLDPDEDMEISRIRQGVEDLKSILDELSLVSYLKTSGNKGYHVVVPINASVNWEDFSNFSKQVALVMEHKWPERYTSNIRKSSRKNKIFIDWIRNTRGSTSVAPYSLRARKNAKVSMPIAWDELYTVAPDGINMHMALKMLDKEDPWKDFFKNNQGIK